MEDIIFNKIKNYCEKASMKMDKFSITEIEDGYIATDGYTSIMFDKDGVASSLPRYNLYGNKTTQIIGKGYAIFMYGVIVLGFIIIIIGSLIK